MQLCAGRRVGPELGTIPFDRAGPPGRSFLLSAPGVTGTGGSGAPAVVGYPRTAWRVGETLRSCSLCDPRLVTYPLGVTTSCIMEARLVWILLVLSSCGFLVMPRLVGKSPPTTLFKGGPPGIVENGWSLFYTSFRPNWFLNV